MKNHHKTMKIEDSEAEILRTPIKIEKLSWRNRSGSGFIMNFEFHGFLGGFFLYFLKLDFFIFYLWMITPPSGAAGAGRVGLSPVGVCGWPAGDARGPAGARWGF